jgi:type II secretory pathway pseudopilin PulG
VGALSGRRQRGFTLLEMVITVGFIAILIIAGGAFAYSAQPYAARSAALRMTAMLATARQVAASSGNGATVTFSAVTGGTLVTLYPGRPNGGTFGPSTLTDTIPATVTSASVAASPLALFIDSAGTGTATAWAVTSPAIAVEPACPGALDLTFVAGSSSQTHALSCADMVLH